MTDSKHFLDILTKSDAWNRRHFMAMLACFGVPPTYLDVGCGTGVMPDMAYHLGVDAIGLDLHDYEEIWYQKHDLSQPLKLKKSFQLVTCIEVAEHIHPSYDGIFMDTISRHVSSDNGVLVFTAAHPGQEGEDHVNTRPAIYWRDQFYGRGLGFNQELTARLSLLWSNINSPLYWLPANVQVFTR